MSKLRFPLIHPQANMKPGPGKVLRAFERVSLVLNVFFVLLATQSRGWIAAGCWVLAVLCQLASYASMTWCCLISLRSPRTRGSDRVLSWAILLMLLAWTGWIVWPALQQKR